ncbi:hypothetical protein RDWZM_008255 [Blomia tropicalis]|uniref:Uncharacterized protein n=1 Tax=Blomia tropicalis TaxID=40697 RepID=A0A9Q0LZ05_BLOTA|nr:hypothetical protein RDWZM_008255 [Blomia tropicalis]
MDNFNMSIKPKQSLNLSLENVSNLKNPRLSIALESDDEHLNSHALRTSVSAASINSIDYDGYHNQQTGGKLNCKSCESLKRMLYFRDRTIMKIAEDRDIIKIKLTKAMNMNIELSRQLMRYDKENKKTTTTETVNSPLSSTKSPINAQIRDEVADLRRKCSELDAIYNHLKHHLYSLKNFFDELGTSPEEVAHNADSGSGYHDDCDEYSKIDESFHPLPPAKHSVAKPKQIDPNNNSGKNSKSNVEQIEEKEQIVTEEQTSISNFDKWYNS